MGIQTEWIRTALTLVGTIALLPYAALAQIVPDHTLGAETSIVTEDVVIRGLLSDRVDGGARRGGNLFHSFAQFNIPIERGAYFANPDGITTILSRVTGSDPSNLSGLLGVLGNADLFFINPNGIVFGPESSLDVSGSFVATTANGIQLGEQGSFSATNPASSTLLTVNPSAFLFNSANLSRPAAIAVNTTTGLLVPTNQSLLLVGGDVNLDSGRLFSPGGAIALTGIAEPGTIGLTTTGNGWNLVLPTDVQQSNLMLDNGAVVFVTNGGSIHLNGDRVSLDNGSFIFGRNVQEIDIQAAQVDVAEDSFISSSTQNDQSAGDVHIRARDLVQLTDNRSVISTASSAAGETGRLTIEARHLVLENGAAIISTTTNQGDGRDINLQISDTIQITEGLLGSLTTGTGAGSDLLISTGSLSIQSSEGAGIGAFTEGAGSGGTITLQAREQVAMVGGQIVSESTLDSLGSSGDIIIETGELNLTAGGVINVRGFTEGSAGNIVIRATDAINIVGVSPARTLSSTISSATGLGAIADAGSISITTRRLSLRDGGNISASSIASLGNAGDIEIQAETIEVTGSEQLQINGRLLPTLSEITSEVLASETAVSGGTITIDAARLRLSDGGNITTSTLSVGDAGDIVVRISDTLTIRGRGPIRANGSSLPSGLFSQVQTGGIGNGGTITVEAANVQVRDGGSIGTTTFNQGNAGNIRIRADRLLVDDSLLLTSVEDNGNGNGGDFDLTAGQLIVRNSGQIGTGTSGRGNSGDLTVRADRILLTGRVESPSGLLTSVSPGANGNGGNLRVVTNQLVLREGAAISASTRAQGDAGDIEIRADAILLEGIAADGIPTGISARTRPRATGEGGDITLTTDTLQLSQGAVINAGTANRFDAGDITINAGEVQISDAQIAANSQGQGNASNINFQVDDTLQLTDGNITTAAAQATGGAVTITAGDIRLNGDSDITTNVNQGRSQGGNITLTADSILAFADSDILAFARDGRGGNVTLNTPAFFGENYQSVSSNTNPDLLDGNDRVDINATGSVSSGQIVLPDVSFIQNSLTNLPETAIDPDQLLANSCIARTEQGGTFLITGSGGLPTRPGDAPLSAYPTGAIRAIPAIQSEATPSQWQMGDPIQEPQSVYQLPDGRLVLSRECQ
jgi:filamentous hemagglutinin family protein